MNDIDTSTRPTAHRRSGVHAQPGDGACCAPSAVSVPVVAGSTPLSDLAQGTGADALAGRLKALADPTRLRMLALLAEHSAPLCVCEITPRFELHQPTISHHLRLLRQAGLADCERRGVWAYYWATEAGQRALSLVVGIA